MATQNNKISSNPKPLDNNDPISKADVQPKSQLTPRLIDLQPSHYFKGLSLTAACLLTAFGLSSCSPQQSSTKERSQSPEIAQPSVSAIIPSPDQMRAKIKVEGRLSTLLEMDIRKVGRQIPYTYSAGKIANSPGYEWWVSKHFAIKSDLPEEKVKLYLELLEMSYPHYVELFGAEPANIENQRIAVVYGKSRVSTRNTMLDDGFRRGVHKNAGGETMFYNRAGYSFPSSREQHQRYIVIHETMHAFHMALSGHSTWAPNWITEGLADSIASHVYYPERQQLAVMVRDRAPMSYLISGLKQYYAGGEPSIADINDNPALKRGLNFFIIHFLLSDPERAQYFAWFRDKLMAANPHSEATLPTANRLLKEVFPDWPALEKAFASYVKSQHSSFHIASGPWEQDGSAYWIRVQEEKQQPRLDIGINPQGKLLSEMSNAVDFPGPQASPLIDSPSGSQFGLLVDYQEGQLHRGQVGLALGLELSDMNLAYRKNYQASKKDDKVKRPNYSKDRYQPLWIKEGRYLIFEGANHQAFAFSPELLSALQKQDEQGSQLGLNVTLNDKSIDIELRSLDAGSVISQKERIQLSEQEYQSIKQQGISLLANDVSHRLTPYLQFPKHDVQANPKAELQLSNPWQFSDIALLQRVFRACLAEQESGAETNCDKDLMSAYPLVADNTQHGKASEQLLAIENSLLNSANHNTLQQLSGIQNHLRYNQGKPQLLSKVAGEAKVQSQLSWIQQGKSLDQQLAIDLNKQSVSELHSVKAEKLQLQQNISWRGKSFSLSQDFNKPGFDGVCLVDRNNLRDGQLQNLVKLTGPYSGKTNGKLRIEIMPSHAVLGSVKSQEVSIAPYETKSFRQAFELNPDFQGEITVHSSAHLEVDGEAIYLSKEQRIKRTEN